MPRCSPTRTRQVSRSSKPARAFLQKRLSAWRAMRAASSCDTTQLAELRTSVDGDGLGAGRQCVDQIEDAMDLDARLAQRLDHAAILGFSKIDVDATQRRAERKMHASACARVVSTPGHPASGCA